jgi:hypothetical protein
MFVVPQPGEPTKKTVDGKTYWWCTNHKSRCRHSTEKCKGRNIKQPQQRLQTNEGAQQNEAEPTLQLSQALAHLAEAESDEE